MRNFAGLSVVVLLEVLRRLKSVVPRERQNNLWTQVICGRKLFYNSGAVRGTTGLKSVVPRGAPEQFMDASYLRPEIVL